MKRSSTTFRSYLVCFFLWWYNWTSGNVQRYRTVEFDADMLNICWVMLSALCVVLAKEFGKRKLDTVFTIATNLHDRTVLYDCSCNLSDLCTTLLPSYCYFSGLIVGGNWPLRQNCIRQNEQSDGRTVSCKRLVSLVTVMKQLGSLQLDHPILQPNGTSLRLFYASDYVPRDWRLGVCINLARTNWS